MMSAKHINTQNSQEQLYFINSIMEDSQKVIADNGAGSILWGILILTAGFGSQLLEYLQIDHFQGLLYLVIVGLGWLYMYTTHRNQEKCILGNPWTKKIIDSIWIPALLSMTILGFVGGYSGTIDLFRMTAVMFTVLGIAYFMQGIITGKTWARNLGYGWWAGSILLFFLKGWEAGLRAVLMMIGLQIIPGIIFNRQWKVQFSGE